MISVSLDKESYIPGETVLAEISCRLPKLTRARGIFVSLTCIERKRVQTRRTMDQYDLDRARELGLPTTTHIKTQVEERDSEWYFKELKISGEGSYLEGTFTAEFTLPKDAPFTSLEFGHDNLIHVWKVRAKLDIPFAPDQNAEADLIVEGL
jgi:hypothetical protein